MWGNVRNKTNSYLHGAVIPVGGYRDEQRANRDMTGISAIKTNETGMRDGECLRWEITILIQLL